MAVLNDAENVGQKRGHPTAAGGCKAAQDEKGGIYIAPDNYSNLQQFAGACADVQNEPTGRYRT
jgi:hypothetical protein